MSALLVRDDAGLEIAPGTLLARRYRVGRCLGAGGMGVVYRARDEELGLDVALKVLRSGLSGPAPRLDRFRQELRIGREISHRNVVRIHDIGDHEGLPFLTMRLVEGVSLEQILAVEGRLPLPRALAIARQVAEGLAAAHDAGFVHRDLKPGNVLVDEEGNASIADFGLACAVAGSGLTRSGDIVGTLDYLSPEQVAGNPVDARSDVWALGVLLYEMLTGDLPFARGTTSETVAQRLVGKPRDPARIGVELPRSVRRVLSRCLARRPDRRYRSARALLADLDAGPAVRPWRAWAAAGAALVAAVTTLAAARTRPESVPAAPTAPVSALERAAERALAAAPPGERVAARIRARLALLAGKPAEAERAYRELLARRPDDTETRVDLAAAQAAQGRHVDAAASLRRVVPVDRAAPRTAE